MRSPLFDREISRLLREKLRGGSPEIKQAYAKLMLCAVTLDEERNPQQWVKN